LPQKNSMLKFVTFLLSFWVLLPMFIFAQDKQITECFPDVYKSFKNSSPKLLPTKVQNAYDVKWYFLNLNAENTTVALSGDVTIKAQVVWSKMDTFSFHLHENYVIEKVLINGVQKTVINNGHERLITGLSMLKNTVFDAQIFYHGNAGGSGNFFSGISNATDPRWGTFKVTWTLSEPNNAYEWFPVKQNLTDKADSSWVFVTTTKPNKVASNGKLTKTVDLPDNKVRYEWKSSYPIDYYLISIAVAEYQDYSIYATIPQTGEQLLIQNYIYNSPQCLNANQTAIDETKEMIEYYSTIFGAYPFSREKYGHALSLMGGAMEHQTMTTTGYLYTGIIAHELVHQWFGDNVTCASWQHIWLNEGFATYGADLLWEEYKNGKIYAFNKYKQNVINSVINSGKNGSVFVPLEYIDEDGRIFDNILSYKKGSILAHMIRYELGDNDELFFNVLKTYQNRFKDNVATTEDLQGVIKELSGKDFSTFFAQWFYGEGYPMFNIKWNQADNHLIINSEQTTTAPITPLFKINYDLQITYTDDTDEIVSFYHDDTNKEFSYTISNNKTVKSISFDPNYWLLATATVVYDPTIGIKDINCKDLITVYPNPTTGELKIENGELKIENVEIFDVYGRKIFNFQLSTFNSIDISHLPAGVYFLSVRVLNHDFIKIHKINKIN